jgi:3-oxoadipate enol-lactonase
VQQWEERMAIAREQGMEPLVEPTAARWFPEGALGAQPALAAKVKEMIRTTPPKGFIGCAAAISNFDFKPGLGAIKVPALVVVGTKDAMLGGSREAQAAIPGSRLVELDGCGHLSNLDGGKRFTDALEAFLGTAGSVEWS